MSTRRITTATGIAVLAVASATMALAALAEAPQAGVVNEPQMLEKPKPPGQPASGPGGRDYRFSGVVAVNRGTVM